MKCRLISDDYSETSNAMDDAQSIEGKKIVLMQNFEHVSKLFFDDFLDILTKFYNQFHNKSHLYRYKSFQQIFIMIIIMTLSLIE